MKILRVILIAVVFAAPADLRAATIVDDAHRFPDVVNPGQTVTVAGTFDPATQTVVTARLYPLGSTDDKNAKDAKDGKVTPKLATLTLPDNLPPGKLHERWPRYADYYCRRREGLSQADHRLV